MDQNNNAPLLEEKTLPARNLAAERLQIASPAIGIAVIFGLSILLQSAIHAIVLASAPAVAENDWYPWVLSMVPMYGIAMPASLLLFRLGTPEPPKKQTLRPIVLLGLMATCFALAYAGNIVGNVINVIISIFTGKEITNELAELTTSSPFWINLLFCGILAPIMEEIFYRKLVIDRLRRYGDLPAILISGLAFGLIHGNVAQFCYASLLGMLFGYIYLNTGKIRYTIALHMGINMLSGVLATEVLKALDLELLATDFIKAIQQAPVAFLLYLAYIAFVLLLCIAGIVCGVLLFVRCRKPLAKAENPLSAREWVKVLALNPGVWVFAAVVVLLFL